jgi:molybdopterin-binding protein
MNVLHGTIQSIHRHASVAVLEVAVEGLSLTAMLLGNTTSMQEWQVAQHVRLLFNETEVALAKNLQGEISMRNRLPGRIVAIEAGEVLTRVVFALNTQVDSAISSVVTTRSARAMQLAVGDQIEGLVKSTEMNLQMVAAS